MNLNKLLSPKWLILSFLLIFSSEVQPTTETVNFDDPFVFYSQLVACENKKQLKKFLVDSILAYSKKFEKEEKVRNDITKFLAKHNVDLIVQNAVVHVQKVDALVKGMVKDQALGKLFETLLLQHEDLNIFLHVSNEDKENILQNSSMSSLEKFFRISFKRVAAEIMVEENARYSASQLQKITEKKNQDLTKKNQDLEGTNPMLIAGGCVVGLGVGFCAGAFFSKGKTKNPKKIASS